MKFSEIIWLCLAFCLGWIACCVAFVAFAEDYITLEDPDSTSIENAIEFMPAYEPGEEGFSEEEIEIQGMTDWSISVPEDDTVKFIFDESAYSDEVIAYAKWCYKFEPCQTIYFECSPGEYCTVSLHDADGNERGAVVYDKRSEE